MTLDQDRKDNISDSISGNGNVSLSNQDSSEGLGKQHKTSFSSGSDTSDSNVIITGGTDTEDNTFEGLLKICGEAGRWQLKVFLLASFCGFCTGLHNLNYAFIGASPDHWCKLPAGVEDRTPEDVKHSIIPRDGNKFSSCEQFEHNVTEGNLYFNPNQTFRCYSHEFDNSTFKDTIVTEYDLVCDYAPSASAIQAMYMFGILCGSPIFGAISDQFGRKKTIIIATVIFNVAGPLIALVKNFSLLMFARWLLAFSSPGIYGTSFVLTIETLGPDWRGLAGNLFCLPFAFGYMALPGVAYLIREWRYLQLVLCIPSLILLITAWLIPESPRWLLRKGQIEQAEIILRQMALHNGRKKNLHSSFSEIVARVGDTEKEVSDRITIKERMGNILSGYYSLVKSPKMRVRTLVIYFCWASISMIYYGIALNSPNLATDRYVYTFIGGVLEIPSYFMVPPLIKFIGRKYTFTGFLLLCAVSLLGTLLFETGTWIIVTLALFGKLVIGAAYALIYLYATELMPTILRTYGLGTASMIGRIGSVAAPYIVDLVGNVNNDYPSVVFGAFSLAAGLVSILLPETRNRRLPDTVDDVEFDKN